jgi:hypothetical protein
MIHHITPMIYLQDSESELIRGGSLVNLTLPGINIPVLTQVGTGVALGLLEGTASNTSVNDAALASLLASFKF